MKKGFDVGDWPLAIGRWRLAVGLTCALYGFSANPAQAAHWKVTLELNGISHNEDPQLGVHDIPWQNNYDGDTVVDYDNPNFFGDGWEGSAFVNPQIDHLPLGHAYFHEARATSSGKVKVVFTWTKDAGEAELPPVPDTVTFQVTPMGRVWNENSGTPVHSELVPALPLAREGQSLDDIWVDDFGNGPLYAHNINTWQRATRTYLMQKKTNGQTRVEWETPQMNAETRFDAGFAANSNHSSTDAHVGLSAKEDKRSVTISSSVIEPSYHRTMDGGQQLSKYRNNTLPVPFIAPMVNERGAGLLNERNGDGSFVVDSAAKWDAPSGQWMGRGTYQANLQNFTNSSIVWGLTGGSIIGAAQDELASGHSNIDLNPFTGLTYDLNGVMLGGNIGSIGTAQTMLKLAATDSDGSVGINTYVVNWHMPYEKLRNLSNGDYKKNVYWVSDEPLTDGGGISATEILAKEFDYLAAIDDVLVVTKAAGLPTDQASELLSLFKALTNISNWGETAAKIEVVNSPILNNGEAFRAAIRERPENFSDMTVSRRDLWKSMMDGVPQDNMERLMSNYDCFAGRVRYHHKESVLADEYDIHGFVGPNRILSHDVTDRYQWDTFYSPVASSPVPPALGDREIPPSYYFD